MNRPTRRLLIAITGYGQADDRQRVMDSGFDAHWTKPVDPARLAKLLNTPEQAQAES